MTPAPVLYCLQYVVHELELGKAWDKATLLQLPDLYYDYDNRCCMLVYCN